MTDRPLLLRMGEAAELLGVSRATAYRMASDGEIPVVRIRGQLRCHRPSLERHLEELAGGEPSPVHLRLAR